VGCRQFRRCPEVETCGPNVGIVLSQLASAKERLHGDALAEALAWARDLLKPVAGQVTGIRETCIVQWRFDAPSMWRGTPDNPRVLKLIKCIISTRFRKDSIIASRTLDLSAGADTKDRDWGAVLAGG